MPSHFAPAKLIWLFTVLGLVALAVSGLAPVLGLGENEQFILYRAFGIARRPLFYAGAGLLLLGVVLALLRASSIRTEWGRLARAAHLELFDRISRSPASARDQTHVALVVALIGTALFLVLAALPTTAPLRSPGQFPEFVSAYGMVDSGRQLIAHRVTLVLLAICVLCAGWLCRWAASTFFQVDSRIPGALGIAIFALLLLAWLAGLRSTLLVVFIAFVIGWGALLLLGLRGTTRATRAFIATIAAAYAIALIVPGLLGPLLLVTDQPYDLAQIESHLSITMLPSSVLAAGYRLFDDITPSYGLLMPTLVAIFERHAGLLDVAGQIRLVQLSQAAFVIVAVLVLVRIRDQMLPALLPLVMVGPFVTTAGLALWHPNQSGLRHIGFPLGLLILQLMRRLRIDGQAALLGFTGTWLYLLNAETGAAIICGFGFYLYLQCRPPGVRKLLQLLAWAILGSLASLLAFAVIHRIGLGYWVPFDASLRAIRRLIDLSSGQYAGVPLLTAGPKNINLAYVPLALVMLFHGSYLVMLSALRTRCRPLTERELSVGATSLILVMWLAYYFNYPSWWNLWIPIFLYGVVLASLFDIRRIRLVAIRPRRLLRRPWWALTMALVLMVCAISHVDLVRFTRGHFAPDWRSSDSGVRVSGILTPTKLAGPLQAKAAFLKNSRREGPVAYSTLGSDFMPVISGAYQSGPEIDFWFAARGSQAVIRNRMAQIAAHRPRRFLTDDQTGPLAYPGPRGLYVARIRRIVSEYFTQVDRAAGWDIWIPKSH